MTNTELAYVEDDLKVGIKKFVFSISKSKEEESLTEFAMNKNLDDNKSFFTFSTEEIEKAKLAGKKCEIEKNKEYKMSELHTMCENLYSELNTRITKFSEKVNVEYYSVYHISMISNGYADAIPLEAANALINLNKVNPTTYPVKAHLYKIYKEKGIYLINNRMISFLYKNSIDNMMDGKIETDKIISWSDRADHTSILLTGYDGPISVVLKIFLLSPDSDIVYYSGVYGANDNIFLLYVGKQMKENDITTEVTTQLTNVQKTIKDSYKQTVRMRNLNDNVENKSNKDIKVTTVDSWFYEDVTANYYKGYFISGDDFTYIEKTKSNDAKILEKIVYQQKIDWTAEFPSITITETDEELKVTLKETVESCNSNNPYKANSVKQLCPTADPKFAEVLIQLSKAEVNMDIVIGSKMESMKISTTEQNNRLINLIGLETKKIPIDKYITHEDTYSNGFSMYENHYYRLLPKIELDISETETKISNFIKFGIFMNARDIIGEYNRLGELYFFTLPNLSDKYLIQRELSDFYKYDSEFNDYDSNLNDIISNTSSKVDLIIKRITEFMKDDDDISTPTTTTPSSSDSGDSGSGSDSPNESSESTSSNSDESVSTDNDLDSGTTTPIEDKSGCYLTSTILFVIFVIIVMMQ